MGREMKYSGLAWAGDIPVKWNTIPFSYAVTRLGTGLNPRDNFVLTKEDDLFYVTIRNYENGKILLDDNCDRISVEAWGIIQERSELKKGDILFASISEEGKVFLIEKTPVNWNINESIFCIRFDTDYFDLKYASYHLMDKAFYEDLRIDATGTTFRSIKQNKLRQSRMVMPPLDEQKRIVDFLDDRCAKIDSAIKKTQKTIEEYKALKQSIITEAVTKGIHGDRSMKDSGIECIGEIPSEWSRANMKWLCRLITDGSHFSPESIDDGYPYITAKDVHGEGITYKNANKISYDDYILLEKNGCRPRKDDVLLVKDGATTGRVGRMIDDKECVLLSSVAKLTPNEKYVTSKYLMYLLMSDALQKQITIAMAGSAMPRITLIKLVNFYGLVCPINEQQEIVAYLDKKCESLGKLITAKETILKELETYKKSLIYEYVTGKKEVLT